MESYPAASVAPFNGQLGSSIGPIRFESEPYHYDVSNSGQGGYNYDNSYAHNQYNPQAYVQQYPNTAVGQGAVMVDQNSQNGYGNQQDNSAGQQTDANGYVTYTPRKNPVSAIHHCDVCDKAFSSNASMRRHREIHDGVKKFACELCGNSYTQKHNLTKHMRLHTGEKPYKCHLCEKAFYIHHHLRNHLAQHAGVTPYKCTKCKKAFKHRVRFERHLKAHEDSINTEGSVAQSPPSVFSEDNSMSEIWDNGTDMEYEDENTRDTSMYDSFEDDDELSKYDEQECEVCQQIFINKESLDKHFKLQHSVDREFKCDECNNIFLTRAHLVRHRRTHTGEQIYECEECNVSFRWKVSLHIHMRRHNNDYKRYDCTMCNKYFLAKESLKKHMNMHLGMNSYECDECKMIFTQKLEYKNHILTHGEGGSETEKNHSSPKGPPTCKVCGKTFSSNSSLRKHEYTHMDEKPHKCELCNVSFAQKIQLRLHNKKHNGGKMDPPLFYRPKKNQVKKEDTEDSDSKSDASPSRRRSPSKNKSSSPQEVEKTTTQKKTSPRKTSSPVKEEKVVTSVKIKIDKSKIIPERRNMPRRARNVIKEETEDEEEEEEEEEQSSVEEEEGTSEEEKEDSSAEESETSKEESDKKRSRWEGYRYPVCENCNQVFKKRKALIRHQKSCKQKE